MSYYVLPGYWVAGYAEGDFDEFIQIDPASVQTTTQDPRLLELGVAKVISRVSGYVTGDNTVKQITLPSGIQEGDTLIAFLSTAGTSSGSISDISSPDNWYATGNVERHSSTSGVWSRVQARAVEVGELPVSAGILGPSGSHVSYVILLVRNSRGVLTDFCSVSTTYPNKGTNTANSTSPPISYLGSITYSPLWITSRFGEVAATAAPTNYSNFTSADTNLFAKVSTAERTTLAKSETPGSFTSPADDWLARTTYVLYVPVTYALNVTPASIAVTTLAPNIKESITGNTASITVTTQDASIPETVPIDTATVTVTANDAAVGVSSIVDVETASIDVTTFETIVPDIIGINEPYPFFVNPRTPTVRILQTEFVDSATIDIAPQDANIVLNATIEVEAAEIIVAPAVPDVIEDDSAVVAQASVAIEMLDPFVIADAIIPDAGTIVVTTNDVQINELSVVQVQTAAVAVTTRNPIVVFPDVVPVTTASIAVTTKNPLAVQPDKVLVDKASIAVTTQAPNVPDQNFPWMVAYTNGGNTGNTISIQLPSNIAAGDLLLVVSASGADGTIIPTITWDNATAGTWTNLRNDTREFRGRTVIYYKQADGTEDSKTLTVTANGANNTNPIRTAWRVFQIKDWFGGTSIEVGAALFVGGPTYSAQSLNPSGWDVENTMWLTLATFYPTSTTTVTLNNANYRNAIIDGFFGGSGLAGGLASASRNIRVAQSPGESVFTLSTSAPGMAYTIAIRPLKENVIIPVDTASVTVTTQAANLNARTKISVDTAAVSVTTRDPELKYRENIFADRATITVTTQPAVTIQPFVEKVGTSFIGITTRNPQINEKRKVEVDTQTYTVTLNDVTTSFDDVNPVDTQTYTVTTYAPNLKADYNAAIDTRAFLVTTKDPVVNAREVIEIDAASIALTANEANANEGTIVQISTPQISVSTNPVNVKADYNVASDSAAIAILPQDANINAVENVLVDAASISITSFDPTVLMGETEYVDTASILVTTQEANTKADFNVPVDAASVAITTLDPNIYEDYIEFVDAATISVTTLDPEVFEEGFVDVDLGTISITANDSTINERYDIPLDAFSVTITTQPANTKADDNVAVDADSISVTTYDVFATTAEMIRVDAASIAVFASDATINERTNVEIDTQTLAITTYPAVINEREFIAINTGAIATTFGDVNVLFDQTGIVGYAITTSWVLESSHFGGAKAQATAVRTTTATPFGVSGTKKQASWQKPSAVLKAGP